MRLACLDLGEDLRRVEARSIVAQVGIGIQRRAELGESPSLDQAYLGLRDIAARELVEKLKRRHGLRELVAPRLDALRAAERAGEDLELHALHLDAGLFHVVGDGPEARAVRNLEFQRHARHLQRRGRVPGAVAHGGQHGEKDQGKEGFQGGRCGL